MHFDNIIWPHLVLAYILW